MEPLQVFFQIDAVDELLARRQEQRRDLRVEIISRREHGTERQIVKISQIDLMAWLHVSQERRAKRKAKKDVDRKHENEISIPFAKSGSAFLYPIGDNPVDAFRNAEEFESESKQPFGIEIVDDDVGELPGIRKRLRLSPWAELREDIISHCGKVAAL
jgi:hypothetical protein